MSPKVSGMRGEQRTSPDSDMGRVQRSFDRSPIEPSNLAHHVHTQLSYCLAALQRALDGACSGISIAVVRVPARRKRESEVK